MNKIITEKRDMNEKMTWAIARNTSCRQENEKKTAGFLADGIIKKKMKRNINDNKMLSIDNKMLSGLK